MLEEGHYLVSDEQLRRIMRETMHETLTTIGVDASDPVETQKDFAYLRTWRLLVQKGGTKAFVTAVGFITLGLLAAILAGLGMPQKALALFGVH